ncbi:MAG: coproporphyrinogen III oxidase, partial [Candidatus Binatia bacterium]
YIRAIEHQGLAVLGEEHPTRRQQIGETMMLGLRLMEGVDLSAFARRFGQSFEELYPEALDTLMAEGLLILQGEHLRLTPKGVLLSNEVFAEFL